MLRTLLVAVLAAAGLVGLAGLARAGSVKGTVLFEGEPPTQPILKRDADPKCSQNRADEAIVVAKGKLAGVAVRISRMADPRDAPTHLPAVVIDQRDCMYEPRVVVLGMHQAVVVRNSDNTFHNVHGVLVGGKDLFNKPQAPKAPDLPVDVAAAKPGDIIALQCDIHPWMKSYIVVGETPWSAVTGADGAFDLEGMPEGTYTLEAWHPTLGTKSLTIVIGKAKRGDVTARFSYKASEM